MRLQKNLPDIGVELTNEAGEIVVLEVFGKKGFGEFMRIPNDETIASWTPRHNGVSVRVLHHIERLLQERRGTHLMQPFHRFLRLLNETVNSEWCGSQNGMMERWFFLSTIDADEDVFPFLMKVKVRRKVKVLTF